ncbi:OmpA family protein [Aurantibacillus circumpalustris]|uniref:OmpA family protein n=1 Tax=Aurantibacillus circumpalustris TaxID=3036359 RepID=UPI00295C2326|nr:OmpA family protein [Aurantibacillus circumpalustris]
MKKFIYTLTLIAHVSLFFSQSVEFEKSNFPGRKDEFKDAVRKFDIGGDYYIQGRKDFDEARRRFLTEHRYLPISHHDHRRAGSEYFKNALGLLTEANNFNPENFDLNYMLGFIWFNIDPTNKETLRYLEKAYSIKIYKDSDLPFWLAWSFQLNSQWDDALKHYNDFLNFLMIKAKANAGNIEDIKRKMAECEVGKKLSANPERVFVDNLGPSINTPYAEYGPSISTDETTIFFTARRSNSTGGKRDPNDNGYFEDVYFSEKKDGKWQASKPLSKNVNTDGHDAAAGLSPDGSKLYVYRNTGSDGGDLYEAVLFGLDWEEPARMNKNINSKDHESTVSLSFDGKRLFFVSNKELGYGADDIYYSDMDVNGEWGPAKNIGPEINTKYREEGVFMHPDGVTLYFSSQGHGSMGGFDIFKSTFENGKWSAPINLGYPINGPDDDVFFAVSGSGNHAYFASSKQGGIGEQDLYKITFLGPEKQALLNSQDQLIAAVNSAVSNLKTESAVEVKSSKLTILKGIITDEKSEKPIESTIELTDNEKGTILATFKSNSSTGKYLVTLPSGKNYGLAVKSLGYLFHSENFNLPEAADFQEFNLDISLKKMEVGNSIVLKNIFFDFDKSTIRPESQSELNRLIKLLKDNPALKIELSSHTDDVGSDEYNTRLSFSRSNAVVDYLIAKGISPSRLIPKGYGESVPLESNDTEEGRQKNRRTEFKILSK